MELILLIVLVVASITLVVYCIKAGKREEQQVILEPDILTGEAEPEGTVLTIKSTRINTQDSLFNELINNEKQGFTGDLIPSKGLTIKKNTTQKAAFYAF